MHRILLAVTAMSIALSGAAAGTVTVRDGWVVIDTRQSFPTLVERLEAAVKAEKIGLVTSASASEGAKAAGIAIPDNRVVGVFRNDFARRMLSASVSAGIEPRSGSMSLRTRTGPRRFHTRNLGLYLRRISTTARTRSGRWQASWTMYSRKSRTRLRRSNDGGHARAAAAGARVTTSENRRASGRRTGRRRQGVRICPIADHRRPSARCSGEKKQASPGRACP